MKKNILTIVLTLITSGMFAQDVKLPSKSGVGGVDALANKAIKTYEESKKISESLSLIKIVENTDGSTTIKGGNEDLEPLVALKQLENLSGRVSRQGERLTELIELKKTAADAIKSAKALKKVKASKTMKNSVSLEKYLIGETKTQSEVILQQIGIVKALIG